jgi:ankyrin repeat protein
MARLMSTLPLLGLAAKLGHVEIVTLLLDAGARIDDVDDRQNTACHAAAREGHFDVVKLLVARNANVSLRNRANETPLVSLIERNNESLVMMLIDATMAAGMPLDAKEACLAATVSTDVIRLLLFKYRINLSAMYDSLGRTALHRAVWRSRGLDVLNMLIDVAGIDVDARDEIGCTAAHTACTMRDIGALARLIAAGANLELADNNGETPLHYSLYDMSGQSTTMLLAAGANANAINNSGRSVCHMAIATPHAPLPALLAFGANLDEPVYGDVTPRQQLKTSLPTTEEIALARRRVRSVQLTFVRQRAFEVCVALQSIGLDALCLCEILVHSCGQVAPVVPFHICLVATRDSRQTSALRIRVELALRRNDVVNASLRWRCRRCWRRSWIVAGDSVIDIRLPTATPSYDYPNRNNDDDKQYQKQHNTNDNASVQSAVV